MSSDLYPPRLGTFFKAWSAEGKAGIMRAVHPKLQALIWAAALAAVCACDGGAGERVPHPSVSTVQTGIRCDSGDHGYNDAQLGWAFCYPGTWRFSQRFQQSDKPPGTDATFDIVNEPPCAAPSPAGARPSCPPEEGLFGFMIVGTYQRGGSPTLDDWLKAEVPRDAAADPIEWGNALEAMHVKGTTRRYAMTQHQVVLLDLRSGAGNLDLDLAMSKRLSSWKFSF